MRRLTQKRREELQCRSSESGSTSSSSPDLMSSLLSQPPVLRYHDKQVTHADMHVLTIDIDIAISSAAS